jgi:uncharacterized lipoprotein YajG
MKRTKLILIPLIFIFILAGCGTKSSIVDKNKASADESFEKQGVFNGQADSHTIEVTVDNQVLTLQVKDELQSKVDALSEGDSIKITYSENKNNQNELSAIEKVSK